MTNINLPKGKKRHKRLVYAGDSYVTPENDRIRTVGRLAAGPQPWGVTVLKSKL